ncbi:siderophore ferric iron reductase [Marinospirillum perlucidum]|uniref:siderophore ferric iron reductase n=1 Tax=Marinospirillum perlucidum TaxID=1982602 RepID=UPI00138FB6D7|nr:siderophore ferric iron reductase [Marinospirillum perlucidum]
MSSLLVQQLAGIYPGLQITLDEPRPEHLSLQQDNSRSLQRLLEHEMQQHPRAGRLYWSARCWNLLLWQPVLVSLVAVQGLQCQLKLDQLGQQFGEGWVAGIVLPPGALEESSGELIQHQAAELEQFAEAWLVQLNRVVRMNPALARGLLADRLLGLLLHFQSAWGMNNTALQALATHWLQALKLEKTSRLVTGVTTRGREELLLERKTCCQHYRRDDGELCLTCPRLQPQDKQQRLLQEKAIHYVAT